MSRQPHAIVWTEPKQPSLTSFCGPCILVLACWVNFPSLGIVNFDSSKGIDAFTSQEYPNEWNGTQGIRFDPTLDYTEVTYWISSLAPSQCCKSAKAILTFSRSLQLFLFFFSSGAFNGLDKIVSRRKNEKYLGEFSSISAPLEFFGVLNVWIFTCGEATQVNGW